MKITLKQLRRAKACEDQCLLFAEKFGDSVDVTPELCESVAPIFNFEFAAYSFLTDTARAEYVRIRATAWAEYERIEAPAEYERIRATATAEYERIRATAMAEYVRSEAPAWAKYKRTLARAFALAYNSQEDNL